MQAKTRENTIKLTEAAVLTALSVLLMYIVRFPIFPAAPFLEYDMGDVPVLIGTMIFGPYIGLVILLITSIIQALTVSASSTWIGLLMHLIASGALVLAIGLIYKKFPNIKGMIIGLLTGTILMTALMVPLNLVFTVKFMGAPLQAVKDMLLPVIIPFNLVKGGINSLVTVLLFIPLEKILKKQHLIPEKESLNKKINP